MSEVDQSKDGMRLVDPRIRLAAERTLLAWIRTGLAMMGFGFVVARFALWLRAFAVTAPSEPQPRYHLSVWFGMALVLLGVLTNGIAAKRHERYVRDLGAGNPDPELKPMLGITVAFVLAVIGLAMAAYLVFGGL
jgi:putative membrane protein